MRVALLYNEVAPDATADERDVLEQVEVVTHALAEVGHAVDAVPVSLDLHDLAARLERMCPVVVFNLVESLHRSDRLILAVPALLETLAIPYSGARLEGLLRTTNKVIAKELMHQHDIATPRWSDGRSELPNVPSQRVVVKSRWSHGSLGLVDSSVLDARDRTKVVASLATLPGDLFAEEYIDGREFNLSVLAGADGPEVLPPAEIRFVGFDEGRPRIVGYHAKWTAGSVEYEGTPRTFRFDLDDEPLLARLRDIALRAYQVLGMRGYARVDFRVGSDGRPQVLEVNANPCLSRDAGFLAAATEAGYSTVEVVQRILADSGELRLN